jgi:PhnB protein
MNYLPKGYQVAIPYLIVDGASAAIEFYKKAFGAVERMRLPGHDGRIGHAEIAIGDCVIMLADEFPEMGAKSPKTLGGSPISMMIYVPDVDAVVKKSVAAGATITRPIEDKFYGDRVGGLTDPFGHQWYVATHTKDVSPEELEKAAAAMAAAPPKEKAATK